MDNIVFVAVLELIMGSHRVPLNSTCSYISDVEKKTENKYFLKNEHLISKNIKNKTQWFYSCNPEKWSVSVAEGAYSRDEAKKKYQIAYDLAIQSYGQPEKDSKNFTEEELKLIRERASNDSYEMMIPFAEWNTPQGNLARLFLDSSFFGGKEEWAVSLDIQTGMKAECGGIFEKHVCPDK